MDSETRLSPVLDISEIQLPVFRIGNSVRFDETLEELKFISELALLPEDRRAFHIKCYFWDASDRWFEAVNIVKVKRAPFWIRFMGPKNLIIASYQLKPLSDRPKEWKRAYSDLVGLAEWYSSETGISKSDSRKSLSKCDTSQKLIDWMRTHLQHKPYLGY
ncbi:hypothetical protein MCEMSE15_01889 [Fimbriimonadaceae bacterium]